MQNSTSTRFQEICTQVDTILFRVLQDLRQATAGCQELCPTDLQHIKLITREIPGTEDHFLRLLYNACQRIFKNFCETVNSLLIQMNVLSPTERHKRKDYTQIQMVEYEDSLLSFWIAEWEKYNLLIKWLSDAFTHLETSLILRLQLPSLEEVARKNFVHCVYKHYNSSIMDIISKRLTEERQNQTEKNLLTKYAILTFIELGGDYYKKDVEDRLIKDLDVYYSNQASDWENECTCVQYIFRVECSINAELDRISYYLDSSSESEFIEALKLLFLEQSHEYWLHKEANGCLSLFQDDKDEDLARLGRVTKGMSGAILDIAIVFHKHITTKGDELVQEAENAANSEMFLLKLVALHAHYGDYCSKYFCNHRFIAKEYKDAFKGLCNKEIMGVKFIDLLVGYCDKMLKMEKSMKMPHEEASEFYKVVDLCQFVDHQRLFITSYGWRLYERLLYKMSNLDTELLLIERLGQIFSSNLKREMENQLNDIASCKAPLDVTNMVNGISLTLNVLDFRIWEKLLVSGLTLADRDMADCVAVFQQFYNTLDPKNVHRILSLVFLEGRCCLKTEFENKPVELVMCPFQAALLMLFNENETLAYTRMKELLNISDSLLTSLLLSMSSNDCTILSKEPRDKPILETDYFMVNLSFTTKNSSIKVPPPSPTSTMEGSESFHIDEINHSIIRVLKKSPASSNSDLFALWGIEFGGGIELDLQEFSHRVDHMVAEKYMELKNGVYTLAL